MPHTILFAKAGLSMHQKSSEGDLSMLLEKIYTEKGWDFRNYKRSSVTRRISKRLTVLNISSYEEYSRLLNKDPREYERLFSNLTIKVSEFFREPEVFEALSRIIKESFKTMALKVWCCGCANGEEAYSIAILLSEKLAPEALSEARIFATDIDPEALDAARKAEYREEALRNVPGDMMKRYFLETGAQHKVRQNIRSLVKFGVLDIVQSPSISGVHILLCRNLFIYFNKTLQEQVFLKLDYSLKPGGVLVLGKAEVLPQSYSHRYTPVGEKQNIYIKRLSS